MSRFNNIECPALRAWNQLHFAMQLAESEGEGASKLYTDRLPDNERSNVFMMAARISVKGSDFVQKEVMSYGKE